MLREDNDEDAVLARNATPVFEAVAVLVRRAPSLSYTDFVVENVSGLVPEGYQPKGYVDQLDDPFAVPDVSPAGAVRSGLLALALELNTLLQRPPHQRALANGPCETSFAGRQPAARDAGRSTRCGGRGRGFAGPRQLELLGHVGECVGREVDSTLYTFFIGSGAARIRHILWVV